MREKKKKYIFFYLLPLQFDPISEAEFRQLAVVSNVDFNDKSFFERIKAHDKKVIDAMLLLSLCHTVVTEKNSEGQLEFNASSPDELALINFAKFIGFEYIGTDQKNVMTVRFKDVLYQYRLLHVLEFNSTRKRMSVILRDLQVNQIILYTKGADSIIEKRLKGSVDSKLKRQTWSHLEQ